MASEFVNPIVPTPVDIYWADDYVTTPTVFSGADVTPITDGGAVRSWADGIDGAGNHSLAQHPQPSFRPIFEQTDIDHGLGSIQFDGVDDFLERIAAGPNSLYTLFLVFKPFTSGSGSRVFLITDAFAPSGGDVRVRLVSGDNFRIDTITPTTILDGTLASFGMASGSWALLTLRVDGPADTIGVRINRVQVVSDGTSIVPLSGLQAIAIGAEGGGTNNSQMHISAIITYDSLLNTSDITSVEDYLFNLFIQQPSPDPPGSGDSFIFIQNSTAQNHNISGIRLLNNPSVQGTDPDMFDDVIEQIRIFKNGNELPRADQEQVLSAYTVSSDGTTVILNTPLVTEDQMLIVRQTRQDRPYVQWTNVAQLKRGSFEDLNLFIDQLIFIAQEINDWQQVAVLIDGVTYPDVANHAAHQVTITGSSSTGPHSYATVELIPDRGFRHSSQLQVRKNGQLLVLTTDYTVNAVAQTITLTVALISSDTLVIRRVTPKTRLWPSLPNASSLSTETVGFQLLQCRFLIEELPFLIGIDANPIGNPRRPRRKTTIKYSGPGDRFYYGMLPAFFDSTVFVWKNGILLTEGTDYFIDPWQFIIFLLLDLLDTDNLVIGINYLWPGPFGENFDLGGILDRGVNNNQIGNTVLPAMLIPATADSDTNDQNSELNLVCVSGTDIQLTWDLGNLVNRTATTMTFGLFMQQGNDAGDSVSVFARNADGSLGSLLTTLTGFGSPVQGGWVISGNLSSHFNTRMQDDGVVRLTLRAVGSTSFSAWATEGQVADSDQFGPHMSINGAAYPTPSDSVSQELPENQVGVDFVSDGTALGVGFTGDFDTGFITTSPTSLIVGRELGSGDVKWCSLNFGSVIGPGLNVPMGATIVDAHLIIDVTMSPPTPNPGSVQRATGSPSTWGNYAGFQAALTGPAVNGPSFAGRHSIDVKAIIQSLANIGVVNVVNLYLHGGSNPSTGTYSVDRSTASLYISYNT